MWIVVLILDISSIGELSISAYLLIAAIAFNYLLNVISLVFFSKYLQKDEVYEKHV